MALLQICELGWYHLGLWQLAAIGFQGGRFKDPEAWLMQDVTGELDGVPKIFREVAWALSGAGATRGNLKFSDKALKPKLL